MLYNKIQPSAKLAPFIKCYYQWEHTLAQGQSLTIQSPPSGYEALVFNYDHPYSISRGNNEKVAVPTFFYSGQNTTNYQLSLINTVGMFGVVFQPSAFSTLFRVSVKDTADQRIAIDDILGNEGKQLANQILEAGTTALRVQIIESFLLQKLWLSKLHVTVADSAARLIHDRNGMVSVQELLDEIGSSRRPLERRFIEKVGVSPKFYARIRRFSYISYHLMYQKDDWQELIYKGGYFDQSHFIKDFQFFNRQNPTDYLLQHKELIQFLDKET
jgi:AraC-like DNA-binding protein